MSLGPRRDKRIASMIQQQIGEWLRSSSDPSWIPSVCITKVNVSRDLAHATVYFCSYLQVDATEMTDWMMLNAGQIRGHLGASLSLRKLPILQFKYDDSAEVFEEIEALLKRG